MKIFNIVDKKERHTFILHYKLFLFRENDLFEVEEGNIDFTRKQFQEKELSYLHIH
jgi:hypothetical protein